MSTSTEKEPLRFRVTSLAPLGEEEIAHPAWRVLSVTYLNKADGTEGANFYIPPQWYQPIHDAIHDAIATHRVFQVAEGDAGTAEMPPGSDDHLAVRLLKAIEDEQTVTVEHERR